MRDLPDDERTEDGPARPLPVVRRDAAGHWLPGSVVNPAGRPRRNVEARLRSVFDAELSMDELREIVRAHVQRARNGSVASARLVLEYAVGKPRERLDVSVGATGTLWQFIVQARGAAPAGADEQATGR